MTRQRTIACEFYLDGIGQHTGQANRILFSPAPVNTGIIFKIKGREFPLCVENVFGEAGYTSIGDQKGSNFKTIEHMLSTIHALGIDNLIIKTEDEETPIMDGSALPFVTAFENMGIDMQDAPKKAIKVLKRTGFSDEKAEVWIEPAKAGLTLDVEIDYHDIKPIGRQHMIFELSLENYKKLAAPARSFARLSDVEYLRSKGFALGASMETGIAVDTERILNPEGLRSPNEFVAHKVMDAIGDLFVTGMTIIGRYKSIKGGHAHNNALIRALLSDPANYEVVEI